MLLLGFSVALTPENLLFCFIGVLLGTIVGILPGLGPLTTISLLIPVTYSMNMTSAIIMLSGIYYGVAYGGTITSVLMRIPGEASSVVTCLDGYQMAKKGRAGAALGIAAFGSFFAGTVGVVAVSILSPPLTKLILAFGPAEYAMMMLAGLILVSYLSSTSLPRALLMVAAGLLLGNVGTDPLNLQPRFTFGSLTLADGIDLVPLAIGLFGLSEVLFLARQKENKAQLLSAPKGLLAFVPSREETRRSVAPVARGTVLGFLVGLLPGGGATMASFLSYSVEKKLSRNPKEFGHGAVEGLAGPEAANNAGTAGAFVPLLCMGLPANAITALLIGAFMIHGVVPGPTLINRQPEVFWGVLVSMYIGNVMLVALNLPLVGLFVRILSVPRAFLAPVILTVSMIGVHSTRSDPFDVVIAVFFGFVGYLLRLGRFDIGLLILAFVLGPLFERSARQALAISDGDFGIFLSSPISTTFVIIAVGLFLLGFKPSRPATAS
ncbi:MULTISPECIES: tripartite tricarboxylate transporter permease [unclassified Chelatococcus]|uniref:tripartite tricarboxylate transporter permease n=1 Tax=unclassified Chelatococcus TaxID=2638111 RepID=UPI001BD088C5|nr:MULTISPECIES: tripartite tricarboxylate transporter permease [unclassified Chelatococcus]CAH1655012.1 Uncharacterized 52.8 kDa protein in TAR-I ttuC' 3'region [Hyphomicrobiales bacterium]MBS7742709.1 tripartite tricarboxylate transporter permease [Chelatococcus sp. HY11]MBX3542173.1 tripartite tricarboxylate transporter permease [Chelatococcus sp.]MCO5075611.1 tripartite tricarboxylate transporter permease [Chelatococcus sp.]CAH1695211.1 Uncharacterized 52.8 kDa protein in TAR-I ttuC' 3'reg